MLPEGEIKEQEVQNDITTDFAVDFENGDIGGKIEGKEALKQWIRLALMTPRYKYAIFSHGYGSEIAGCMEEGYIKAMGTVKNAVYDALIYDDRILDVDDFEFEKKQGGMTVRFRVKSVYGTDVYESEAE